MASAEIIGLLCAGSCRYHEPLGAGSKSSEVITKAELSALLAGLSSVAMNLALSKYGLDESAERMLIAQVRTWAAGVAVAESWHVVRGRPTVMNMAALAVFEVVRPNVCFHCLGVGFAKSKTCSCCDGRGFKVLSGRFIAQAIEVSETSYRDTWKARYDKVIAYVQDVDADVNRSLRVADKVYAVG